MEKPPAPGDKLNRIKAISFDLDDTLWDNLPVLLAAEQTLYDWLNKHYPRIGEMHDVYSLRRQRMELAQQRPDLRHRMTQLRKVALQQVADEAGYDPSLADSAFEVFLEARHRITLYDDVVPVLQFLVSRGYKLAALSNGNADVNRLGLGRFFSVCVNAEEAGAAKPDPLMYQITCSRLNLLPHQLAHVGDEPETDLDGAHRAGAVAIWMKRDEQQTQGRIRHDYKVTNMYELQRLIAPNST